MIIGERSMDMVPGTGLREDSGLAWGLNRWLDGLLEACWLTAAVVIPIFFNFFSAAIFEPDKTALLRGISLLVLAAAVSRISAAAAGGALPRLRSLAASWLRLPLPRAALCFAAAVLLASSFSIAPLVSWFGSYVRAEGADTLLSYVVLFMAVVAGLRRPDQLDRLVNVIILASVPVCAYGVVQRLGLDPVPWASSSAPRPFSTLGNPIFLGAYSVMVLPFTLARLVQLTAAWRRSETARTLRLPALAYVLVGSLQLLAVAISGSRGPWLGLLVSAGLFALLLALWMGARAFASLVMGAVTAAGLFILILNIPGGPLQEVRSTGPLSRLAYVLEQPDPTTQVRLLLWQTVERLVLPHSPLTFPDGRPDRFNVLRPIVGYGPETLLVARNRFDDPAIYEADTTATVWDRPHNQTLAVLADTGLLGLAAYLVLLFAGIRLGLEHLGFVKRGKRLAVSSLAGGALGFVAATALRGLAYAPVGFAFGLLGGGVATVVVTGWRRLPRTSPPSWPLLVALAALVSVTGHFSEAQFGIVVAPTWLQLWLDLAVLAIVGRFISGAYPGRAADQGSDEGLSPSSAPFASAFPGLLMGVLLSVSTYDFLAKINPSTSLASVVFRSLTDLGRAEASTFAILGVYVITWLVAAVVLCHDWRTAGFSLTLSAAIWAAFSLLRMAALARPGNGPPQSFPWLLSERLSWVVVFPEFCVWLLLLIVAIGGALAVRPPAPLPISRRVAALTGIAFTAALALAYLGGMRPVRGDMVYHVAQSLPPVAQQLTPLYQQAVALNPFRDEYWVSLSESDVGAALQTQDTAGRQVWLGRAREAAERALDVQPLDPRNWVQMARIWERWSAEDAGAGKAGYLQQADRAYSTALSLAPIRVAFLDEWASFDLADLQDYAAALRKLGRSLQTDPKFWPTYTVLTTYWGSEGAGPSDSADARERFSLAVSSYENEAGKTKDGTAWVGLTVAASAHQALGDWAAAIALYKQAATLLPDSRAWAIYRALGETYRAAGDDASARDAWRQSLAFAPSSQRPALQQLLEER